MFRMVKEFRSLGVFAALSRWSLDKCAADVFFTQHKDAKSQRIKWGGHCL